MMKICIQLIIALFVITLSNIGYASQSNITPPFVINDEKELRLIFFEDFEGDQLNWDI